MRNALFFVLVMPALTSATEVPYRRTDTQHILVRAKINGKGPYNFMLDTGAPLMFVSTQVGKKLGLESKNGLATLERLDIEGGLTLEKVRCRVETPFQLEGMNGMGIAGVEIHGILGYTVLARFRMEIDFTRDKMTWTPLDFVPPEPKGIGKGGAPAGLEMIGTLMKWLGYFAGTKNDPPSPRGFLGIELKETDDALTVRAVLDKSPAKAAGLKADDRIITIDGKKIATFDEAQRAIAAVTSGQTLRLLVMRGAEKIEMRLRTGEGL